jgi:hypothetical protein
MELFLKETIFFRGIDIISNKGFQRLLIIDKLRYFFLRKQIFFIF